MRHNQKATGLLLTTAASAALLAAATPARAQQVAAPGTAEPAAPAEVAPAQQPAGSEASVDSQEIIVTALKRSERLQDVPKAIEVVSQSALTQANVTNVQDLGRISPSIQGAANAGSPPAIRGISSFGFSIGVQAQTGIVLDDVPQPNFSTLSDELSDVEHIEVLPGPQSTLSGRNAAGGLINIVTRGPTATLKASATAEITNDHQKRVAGYVTGPINDNLGFSISGYYNNWDGPLDNVATGDRLGGYDRAGVRAKLRWEPTDKLTVTLTGYYTHNQAKTAGLIGSFPYVLLAGDALSYFVPGTPLSQIVGFTAKPYNRDLYSNYEGELRSHDYGASLRLEYDTPIGTVTSISNFSKSVSNTTTPLFGYSILPDLAVTQDYRVNYKTEELRLTSPSSDRLQYLLGAIYSDTKTNEPYARPVIGAVDWDRTAIFRSAAVFGRVTYPVLEHTFLTGGLRYQSDRQKYRWVFVDGTAPTSTGANTYGFVSGEASVRQEIGRHVNAYFTYANSQTGRAYDLEDSGSATTTGLTPLNSEKVQSYEGGLKTQWFGNRLTLNLSLFDAHYKNYQLQQAALDAGSELATIRLFAIGKVRSRGIELEGSYAATPDLRFSGSATILDAEIRDYANAPCYTGQTTGCVDGSQGNLAGSTMPGASKFKALGSVSYTLRLPSLPFDGTFNALYRYQSSTHFDVLGDPARAMGAFSIVNLTVGAQSHNAKYSLQLFVNNVFNKHYYIGLDREVTTYDPTGAANPAALYGTYARDSSRYGGLRLSVNY